jgi:hypothetical protein
VVDNCAAITAQSAIFLIVLFIVVLYYDKYYIASSVPVFIAICSESIGFISPTHVQGSQALVSIEA